MLRSNQDWPGLAALPDAKGRTWSTRVIDAGKWRNFALGGGRFPRGDVDGNGRVNGILDSLALLRWGFLADDEPPCFEAADVDNDHRISVLLDALWLFTSMFVDGDPPADPGWDFCGPDPDPDGSLGCEDLTGPCPTYKRRP